jgi:predicted nucleic acid-binding protein
LEAVIDSNLYFSTLISQGDILTLFFNDKLLLLAPNRLKEEFSKHRGEILEKSLLREEDFNELAEILFRVVSMVTVLEYSEHLPKAKELLKEHSKDEDFLALALNRNCKIWIYESRFFKLGYAISTKQLSMALSGIEI